MGTLKIICVEEWFEIILTMSVIFAVSIQTLEWITMRKLGYNKKKLGCRIGWVVKFYVSFKLIKPTEKQ